MRMSRRMGLYGGKRSVIVSVYGAKKEAITLTHEKGEVFVASTDGNGYGGVFEIPVGSYTVTGSVSNFSKTTIVDKYTKTVEAWPDTATIYYWYGYAPIGEFSSVAALPNTSPHTNNTVAPNVTPGTNSVTIRTTGDASRGGTAYLPMTKVTGKTLHLVCSDTYQKGNYNSYLAFNMTTSLSNGYSPTKVADLPEGATSATIDISAISGGTYYLAISGNTSHRDGGSKQSYTTVNAIYSVGNVSDVVIKSTSTTVATNDTYRYGNALQATSGFAKVSSLTFGAVNYVGQGTDDHNSMMIPLSGFNFSGKSIWLKLKMWIMTSDSTNHTFQWAITTSRANEAVYKGYGSVTDANQLAQGTINTTYTGGDFSWQTFLLECDNIPANTPLYLYLWRNNTTYGNLHVMDNITVTLDYAVN